MTDSSLDELQAIAGPVSRETVDRLRIFEGEFKRWSSRINLAAPSTLPDLWTRHILDSAQLMPLAEKATNWLDLGSGGGFPGAIVAILAIDHPGMTVTLVESNRKKAAFLQAVLGKLGAPATILPIRIDDASGKVESADVVTARALAPLADLLELSSPWLLAGARALFHKGRGHDAEIAVSSGAWRYDLVKHRSRIDDDSVILDIRNLARRA